MNRLTCSKTYVELPFAHRQPNHAGHCALIHGHGWTFTFTFTATHRDECGFVVDFGGLKWLKAWLEERFDHTLVLNETDPMLPYLRSALDSQPGEREGRPLAKIVTVPDCSAEGLADYLRTEVDALMRAHTANRVGVISVVVEEDARNSATAVASTPLPQ